MSYYNNVDYIFFLILRTPPISTRTDTLFPYTIDLPIYLPRDDIGHGTGNLIDDDINMITQKICQCWRRPLVRNGGEATVCRSEEHTSELQSLMRKSYAVYSLTKKQLQKQIISLSVYSNYDNTIQSHKQTSSIKQ